MKQASLTQRSIQKNLLEEVSRPPISTAERDDMHLRPTFDEQYKSTSVKKWNSKFPGHFLLRSRKYKLQQLLNPPMVFVRQENSYNWQFAQILGKGTDLWPNINYKIIQTYLARKKKTASIPFFELGVQSVNVPSRSKSFGLLKLRCWGQSALNSTPQWKMWSLWSRCRFWKLVIISRCSNLCHESHKSPCGVYTQLTTVTKAELYIYKSIVFLMFSPPSWSLLQRGELSEDSALNAPER